MELERFDFNPSHNAPSQTKKLFDACVILIERFVKETEKSCLLIVTTTNASLKNFLESPTEHRQHK